MYFLTTIRITGSIIDDCRTIGFNSSYGDLYRSVMNKAVDMFENGYYQYAVITFIEEGFYPNEKEQQWFKYNKDNVIISSIERPEILGDYKPYIIG